MPLGRRRNWHRIRVRLTTPHRRGHCPSRRHLGSTHAGPKRGHASLSEKAHAHAGSSGWKAPSGRAVRIEDHAHCKRPQHMPGDKSRPSGGRLGPSSGGSSAELEPCSLLSSSFSESDCGKTDREGEIERGTVQKTDFSYKMRDDEEEIIVQNPEIKTKLREKGESTPNSRAADVGVGRPGGKDGARRGGCARGGTAITEPVLRGADGGGVDFGLHRCGYD